MSRRLAPLLAAAAALAVAMWPATAEVQDGDARARHFQELRERLDGVWVLAVPTASAQRTVDNAVDRAVSAMNMLLRGVARPMIRENTPVNQHIELRFRSVNAIYCRFDTGAHYTTPLNATRNGHSLDGDDLRVTQRYRDGGLEQVFEADQGTRWNIYRPLPDGRIRVDATTQGDMMPQPLRFSLTYRRRG